MSQLARSQPIRSKLLVQLRTLGVKTVTADYDGSNDEGQIGMLEFGSTIVDDATASAVQDLFYELLVDLYGGWPDNEGAFGEIIWKVKDDTIHLVHNTRIEWLYETEEQTV
jgi:hypothetical protein